MPEGVEEAIHKMAKKEAMTGEVNFEDEYDTAYVPDPIDPLDLILNHELDLEEVTESEVKDLKEDGHEDSDEIESIDSGGTIEELIPVKENDNAIHESADENGSLDNNDLVEEIMELIPVKENDNATHVSPQPPNPEPISENTDGEAAQERTKL